MPDAAPTVPAGAGLNPDGLRRLNEAFEALVVAQRLPGAVMRIERRGVVGFEQALGMQDAAQGTPMCADSIFRIYSMTKPLVSLAAMMLFEQGRLQLTDPVARHLPEFGSVRVGVQREDRLVLEPPARAMTVHDLLRHTAGLTYEFHEPAPVRQQYIDANLHSRGRSNAEFSQALASLPLMVSPGVRWEYSRATDVLGRVVEVAGAEPLGEQLRRAIFEPLGMVDTGFHVPPDRQQRIAEPHANDPDTGAAVVLHNVRRQPAFESGGGGLVSTLADYGRFVRMLLNGGSLGGVRLVGRKTLDLMTADHIGPAIARNHLPPGYGFGLGFAVRTATGLSALPGSVGSYGWSGMAGTWFVVDPAEQMTAMLMVQAPGQAEEVRALFQSLVYAALDD